MNPKIQAEIEKVLTKGPCLIPNPESITKDSTLLVCHESDYCDCEMKEAFKAGFALATKMHEECVKGLVEALEQIEFHENPNPHKQEKTLYYRLANEALAAYREAMETGDE